jgi:hypothetical protein
MSMRYAPTHLLALALLLSGLAAAEAPPSGGSAGGKTPVTAPSAEPPTNTVDPLTGLAVDPTLGTLEVELQNDPLADVRDPDGAGGGEGHRGAIRLVRIGFSSPESRETVRMADEQTRQRYARAALADKPVKGGLAPAR